MADIKLPPNNNDAEESVIGSILIDSDRMNVVSKILKSSDFFFGANRQVYEACVGMYERRERIDQITLAEELKRKLQLENIGGASHLAYYVSIVPTSLDAEYYADIVRRLSVSRQIIATGQTITGIGYKSDPDIDKTLEEVTNQISNLKKNNLISTKIITPHEAADSALGLINFYNEVDNAIKSGYYDLDEVTTGFYKKEYTVIGARPSIGKSQLMLDIAENMASTGHKILFVSAEMGMNQIMERKVARYSGVSVRALRKRGLSHQEMDGIATIANQVYQTPITYLCEGTTSENIYNEVEKLKEKDEIDILFVDYLQRLADCWGTKENMNIRTGRASWRMKQIATEFDIPVIVASQLNRASELRAEDNKKPSLADLRDSGSIEQDADNVLLLYRDFAQRPDLLDIKNAKNRQLGVSNSIYLQWNEDKWGYVNMAKETY